MEEPIVNRTARAVISVAVLVFSIGVIVWLLFYGKPENSLHQSALSWSYFLLIFTMLALGLEGAAGTFISAVVLKQQQKAP